MPSESTYLRIVRISAWYDLIISLPYATPLTLAAMWASLGGVHGQLGLAPLPALDTYAVMFANFFGTVVVLWAALRLLRTEPVFGRYDAIGRFAFAAWMINAIAHGATPLLYGFVVIELAFGIAQALPVRTADARLANPAAPAAAPPTA